MEIILSYDYEIFFNKNKSDCINTLIRPTKELLSIMNSYNVKSTFFIDAGYLYTLEKYKHINKIKVEYDAIIQQIHEMESWGHEIGFHIHSHWEDTKWENEKWRFNLSRYKLADFNKDEAQEIFMKYYCYLNSITTTEIRSYRAGGWCIEPFDYIRDPMLKCGIVIDSTVFAGGKRNSNTHSYDFSNYPATDIWYFNEDPSIANENGKFKEMSISSMEMDSYSYFKLMGMKIVKKLTNKSNGNGIAPPLSEITTNLFKQSSLPISMDSVKSEFLMKEFKRKENNGDPYMAVISHPKSMDKDSMKTLRKFIVYALENGHKFSVLSEN
jgi:peptidoglycan/xylan/chitin deacetylase (PgdA/CDA1 family)